MKNPGFMALQMLKDEQPQAEPEMENPEMMNPASHTLDGSEIYLDRKFFGKECKAGEEIMLRATVADVGSKITLIPQEVVPTDEEEAEGESDQGDEDGQEDNKQNLAKGY